MPDLSLLILIGGALHFTLLLAGAATVGVLRWRTELQRLEPLTRQLIWVHGGFIVLVIIAFGVLSILNAQALADGSQLSRSFCGFIAGFWLVRLGAQFFFFDPSAYTRRSWLLRLGYHAMTIPFAYFVAVYSYAALAPNHL